MAGAGATMEQERDKHYGSDSELGAATGPSLQPLVAEMQKIGTITSDPYIDWLVY